MKRSAEARRNIAIGHTGLKASAETRQAISRALTGKPKSAEHRAAMRKPKSAAAIVNMTIARRARAAKDAAVKQSKKPRQKYIVNVLSDVEPRVVQLLPACLADYALDQLGAQARAWLDALLTVWCAARVETVFVGSRAAALRHIKQLKASLPPWVIYSRGKR